MSEQLQHNMQLIQNQMKEDMKRSESIEGGYQQGGYQQGGYQLGNVDDDKRLEELQEQLQEIENERSH